MFNLKEAQEYSPFTKELTLLTNKIHPVVFALNGDNNHVVRVIEDNGMEDVFEAYANWRVNLQWLRQTYGLRTPRFSITAVSYPKNFEKNVLFYFLTEKVHGSRLDLIWDRDDFPAEKYDQFMLALLKQTIDARDNGKLILRDFVNLGENIMYGSTQSEQDENFCFVDIDPPQVIPGYNEIIDLQKIDSRVAKLWHFTRDGSVSHNLAEDFLKS